MHFYTPVWKHSTHVLEVDVLLENNYSGTLVLKLPSVLSALCNIMLPEILRR